MEEDAAPDGEAEAGMADAAAELAPAQAEAEADGPPEGEDPTEEPAVPQMRLADAQNGDLGERTLLSSTHHSRRMERAWLYVLLHGSCTTAELR